MQMLKLNMVAGTTYDDLEVAQETYAPVRVNPTQVREFYPRKEGRVGTRIVLLNGAGLPVQETFEQVEAAMEAATA